MKFITYIKLRILCLIQDRIMFHPAPPGIKPIQDPAGYGLIGTEDKTLRTEDGETLYYWKKEPADKNKPYIVFFHGNAGHFGDLKSQVTSGNDRGYRLKLLQDFSNAGYGFLAVTLRGYGKSTGKPSEQGFVKDVAAVTKLIQQEKYRTIVLGESMGAFSALRLMRNLEDTQLEPKGVVLIAPFSDLLEKAYEVHNNFRKFDLTKYLKYSFDNKKMISETKFKGKILLLHPGEDHTTGPYHSRILEEAGIKNGLNIKLIILQGADHVTWDPHLVSQHIFEEFK